MWASHESLQSLRVCCSSSQPVSTVLQRKAASAVFRLPKFIAEGRFELVLKSIWCLAQSSSENQVRLVVRYSNGLYEFLLCRRRRKSLIKIPTDWQDNLNFRSHSRSPNSIRLNSSRVKANYAHRRYQLLSLAHCLIETSLEFLPAIFRSIA